MLSKIYKNSQINVGGPVEIRGPLNFEKPKADVHEADEKVEAPIDSKEDSDINELILLKDELLEKARKEYESIINDAEFEAAKIIEKANNEAFDNAEAIEEESRKKGYEEGYLLGKEQYDALIEEAKAIREQAISEYSEKMEELEPDILEMVLEISRKVIGMELSKSREDIINIIRQAVDKCTNRESITIKVSPSDYDFLSTNRDKLMAILDGVGNLELKKEASLKPGACFIETPYGSVDAGVDTKLNKIHEEFLKLLGKG